MSTTSSTDNPPEVSPIERRLRVFLEYLIAPITIILNYFGERAIMLGNALAGNHTLFKTPYDALTDITRAGDEQSSAPDHGSVWTSSGLVPFDLEKNE
jgi:hypothetical protein